MVKIEAAGDYEYFDRGNPVQVDFDPLPSQGQLLVGSGNTVEIARRGGISFTVRECGPASQIAFLTSFMPSGIETVGEVLIRELSRPKSTVYILLGPEAALEIKNGDSRLRITNGRR